MTPVADINGQEIQPGGLAFLLCEVLEVERDSIHVRVLNSDTHLGVGVKYDEVLGGVADSELRAAVEDAAGFPQNDAPGRVQTESEGDSEAISRFE